MALNGKLLALDKVPEAEWIYFSFPQSSSSRCPDPHPDCYNKISHLTRAWKIYCHIYFSMSSSEHFFHLQRSRCWYRGGLTCSGMHFKGCWVFFFFSPICVCICDTHRWAYMESCTHCWLKVTAYLALTLDLSLYGK